MSEAGLREPNRRTVSKGIAWSVPIISAAAMAPFAAASPAATCISLVTPSGNTPACAISGNTSTKVAYADGGNDPARTLTHYLSFQVPNAVEVPAGQAVTFTYQLGNAGTTWTPAVSVSDTSGLFTWSAVRIANTDRITVTATEDSTVKGGTTIYGAVLTVTLPSVKSLADSATFKMVSSESTAVSACDIIQPYKTEIAFPNTKWSASTESGLTRCRTNDTSRTIYFY